MSLFGSSVNMDCVAKFEDLKVKKMYKYIVFKLNEHHTEIIVEKTSTSSEYRDFCADLPERECRMAVYDLEFKNDEGSQHNNIILYQWTPDLATTKDRMLAASSIEVLRRFLIGTAVEIIASDYDDVEYDSVKEQAAKLIRA